MIKIHFAYRHIDKPWGGANNFLRALNQNLRNNTEFLLTTSFADPCDILFMNQLSAGPQSDFKQWRLATIKQRIKQSQNIIKSSQLKLVVRAVNLNLNVYLEGGIRTWILGYLQDRKVLKLLNMADMVIFQSQYQHQVFEKRVIGVKTFVSFITELTRNTW